MNFSTSFTRGILAGLLICLSAWASDAGPNIVLMLADDQGWGDLSVHGNTNLHTPHIDSLARDGALFERFYVSPVCSPTRAELLTGRYHARGGVYSTSRGGERLDLDEQTIAEVFKAAGYATGAFGKWHNGMQYPYHPNARGFDEFYGFCSGHWGHYFSPMLEHNGRIVRGKGFVIDDFTDRALGFIEQQVKAKKPFFAYLPYNAPHSPMQVPDAYWRRFAERPLQKHHRDPQKEDIGHTRAALAMCENIDWNVGRLLSKLEDLKIARNTLVVYFSDNGPNGWRWNGGLRGRKGSTDEGGVRSPLLMRWPGKIVSHKRIKPVAGAIDLLPTLTDLAGIPCSVAKPLDGTSLKPLLLASTATWPDRLLFSHWNKKVSVRDQQYMLDHQGRLYDLIQDPGQAHDISQQQPDMATQLRASVANWRRDVLTDAFNENRPFVICHPDSPYTQLPARDAVPQGGIQRSNKFPNDSFFTNWTHPDDAIVWPVVVAATGDYQVEIYYTCPAADIGSTVELRMGDNTLRGMITQPHDPPLLGAAQDRVPRVESYVKDFRSMKLGTLHLKKGVGDLRLQALEIPHAQVMDFRLLMLTRVE
ncbi:arylsulfatase [Planctomycetota bacterium]